MGRCTQLLSLFSHHQRWNLLNPGVEDNLLEPKGTLESDLDLGDGEACHFGVDGVQVIHFVVIVAKSSMSCIGLSMGKEISSDLIAHF